MALKATPGGSAGQRDARLVAEAGVTSRCLLRTKVRASGGPAIRSRAELLLWKTRCAAREPPKAWGVVHEVIAEYVANDARLPRTLRLVAADDPQLGPVLFRLQDCRPPLAGQILEGVGIEYRLVELPSLKVAHLAQRPAAYDLPDGAAQVSACHWRSVDRAVLGGRSRSRTSRVVPPTRRVLVGMCPRALAP